MTALRQHPYTAALFVLLSLADLALTSCLLQRSTGTVYEANWLARQVLTHYGLAGLAAFKGLLVLLTGGLVLVVAAHRPGAARRLASFACVAVGSVVLYSLGLLVHLEGQPGKGGAGNLAILAQQTRDLEQMRHHRQKFSVLLDRVMTALTVGRCTLREAIAEVTGSEQGWDPAIVGQSRELLKAKSDAACIAALVTHGAVVQLLEDGSQTARARMNVLIAAYRADYGTDLLPYVLADWSGRKTGPGAGATVVAQARVPPRASGFAAREGRPRFYSRRLPRGGPRPVFGGRPPRRPMPVSDHRPVPPSWQPV